MASQGCGYDEDFLDAPPEYLQCVICHLVLRDPLQLMECGHHYCSGCFQKIKSYASHLNSELSCPIDRKVIDLTKVLKDVFVERLIADLKLKCKNNGCPWVGELRDIEAHKCNCVYGDKEKSLIPSQCSGGEVGTMSADVLDQIFVRLERCEEGLLEKEKDIAHLKFQLKEAKEELAKRDEDVTCLKKGLEEMKRKELERETENTSHRQEIHNMCILNKEELDDFKKSFQQRYKEVNKKMEDIKINTFKTDENCYHECSGARAVVKPSNPIPLAGAFLWYSNVNEWNVDTCTNSPIFYCHKGGISCKLGIQLNRKKQINLHFAAERGTYVGNIEYNVDIELVNGDGSFKNIKICSNKACGMFDDDIPLICIKEHVYKQFILNDVLSISCTWTCQHQ